MKLMKNGISPDDYSSANKIIALLREGKRMIGNPAMGLKKTLAEKENLRPKYGKTDYEMSDGELNSEIAMLKSGIKGETELADYMTKLVKYDEKYKNLITFASLSSATEEERQAKGYIPDSDFLILYGNHMMILDAKNVRTQPTIPLTVTDRVILNPRGIELLELKSSRRYWQRTLSKFHVSSFNELTVIVNKSGALFFKNNEYWESSPRPVHISELKEELAKWIDQCGGENNPEVSLKLLVELSKLQIKDGDGTRIDFVNNLRATFGI